MNRSKLKTYAPQARRDFIRAMTDRAATYGLTKDKIEPVTVQGDVALIGGKAFPASVAAKRERLQERVERSGFEQTMEAMAYTWFNRFVAIRYMELHGYLNHGYRVLSHPEGTPTPEIVEHAEHVDLPGLDREEVINLKLDGTKEAELYRKLLIAQCNALHAAMPFLFERIADETELLLPDSLLHSDSLVRKLVTEIDEADWQEVEIIGWLYQFYISEKKDEVIGSVVKSEDIPAATQLFTPNWIVKYLVQNSLGRQWLATYPDSPLKAKMEFYIEPAEQTPEVQSQLKAITPESLNPEELTFLDPACGSGHILVEAYSLLKDIYLERGYRLRDIPKLILTKNLFGLEIDDRAAQLASFALLMMARADDRNILSLGVTLNVLAIQQTDHLDTEALLQAFTHTKLPAKPQPTSGEFGFMDEVRAPLYNNASAPTPTADPLVADLRQLLDFFKGAKTFGSLLQVPLALAAKLPALRERITTLQQDADLTTAALGTLIHLVSQADLLACQYDCVAANPPYIGLRQLNPQLKSQVNGYFKDFNGDLFSAFIARSWSLSRQSGRCGFMSPNVWMHLSSYEELRHRLLTTQPISSLVELPLTGFSEATVQICAFIFSNTTAPTTSCTFIDLKQFSRPDEMAPRAREAIQSTSTRWRHEVQLSLFDGIPGKPLNFDIAEATLKCFTVQRTLGEALTFKQGIATSDNERFLRLWHEVSVQSLDRTCLNPTDLAASPAKWFPYNKGGAYRKWYGNNEFIVNWENDGREMKAFTATLPQGTWVRLKSREYYCLPCITYSSLSSGSFGCRISDSGFLFDTKGSCIFGSDSDLLRYAGLLNSEPARLFLDVLCPTLDYSMVGIKQIPLPAMGLVANEELVRECRDIARRDWDSHECSWDFAGHPLVGREANVGLLRDSWTQWEHNCSQSIARLQALEEANNSLMIEAYGLGDVLKAAVPQTSITHWRANCEEDCKRFLSYCLGCAMGRYSLDKPGLIYANSGNEDFDPAAYATFPADKDGIIPVTEEHWFADDAAARFEEFVGKAWPAEHLDENLAFVAEGLGAKANESPRQTIRRYLSDGFYKHHLQTYKRRPIYWLFTSGKQRAFQALVYLHRYNEGTLSRMRTEYVIPLQGKIAARIEKLEADKAKATSTSHRKGIEKEQDKLRKQQAELITFDEKLRHYADLRIKLDLDDGVKVNYRKFADPAIGEIVAEVKAVCGKDDEL
ncbi:MAG: BREX-1 system adenine-specific DNA-methyltransferase PglX [Tepidisphaeraceae bacterium]